MNMEGQKPRDGETRPICCLDASSGSMKPEKNRLRIG